MHCQAKIEEMFPILVMTRNESNYLSSCIDSILDTTTIPVYIYIIDNCSDDPEQLEILSDYDKVSNIKVIRNNNNRWILGLNETLSQVKLRHKSKYFFLTDGDIDFSQCHAKPCWLTYLVSKMEHNVSIGKIGLSLDWDVLELHPSLKSILSQEKTLYNCNKKIGDLYVSEVDTTASIFRYDWSIEPSGRFYPDHIRYLKPELYSCRTRRSVSVLHRGWETYLDESVPSKVSINSKVICFTIVGGDVKKQILEQSSTIPRLCYKLFSKPIKKIWTTRRIIFLAIYFFSKGIRRFDGHGAHK